MPTSLHTVLSAVILSSGSLLSAQQPARPASAQPEVAAAASNMRVEGCLRAAVNPTMEKQETIYTLELRETATAPAASAGGSTAAGKAMPSSPKSGSSYALLAGPSVGLDRHIDHHVELTGSLKAATPAATPGSTPATPSTDPAQKPTQPGGAHNTFEVTSLRMIGTCPAK